MAGIYIHVPFCRQACHYCDFHFSTSHRQIENYIAALQKEIALQKDYLKGEMVRTVYFGGGTPSLLEAAHLQSIMKEIALSFKVDPKAEVTLEANPDDITPEKLNEWRSAGINRLSIGVQSFRDTDLAQLNRVHTSEQSLLSIALARSAGFENITIDLIYGINGLSDQDWIKNIQTAFDSGIQHLSCYALTVEPRTALASMIRKGKMPAPSSEKAAAQFEILMDMAEKSGWEHYEISNFCKPGFRSKHNSSYWTGEAYLGLGPSAHSFDGASRQWNVSSNSEYIRSIEQGILPAEKEVLTPGQKINEYIMISLRTIEGLDFKKVGLQLTSAQREERESLLRARIGAGWMEIRNDKYVLTKKGRLMADAIAAELFL